MSAKKWIRLVGGIAGLVITWGILLGMFTVPELIQTLRATPTELEIRLEAMRLRKTDFPASAKWEASKPHTEEATNAITSMVYAYNRQEAFWIKVSQRIQVYSNAEIAQGAYQRAVLEWFTPAWTAPDLAFTSQADRMELRCHEGYINNMHHHACRFVGIYDGTVVVILANVFDDQWFTMTDFEQLLTTLDHRMIAAMEQTTP